MFDDYGYIVSGMLKWFLIHPYFTLELTLSSRINLEVEREPPRF